MISLRIFIRRAALALVLSAAPILGVGIGPFAAGLAHADVVSSVVVKGNVRIEVATIKNYVIIKPGKPYAPAAIDQSAKPLFHPGLFPHLTISPHAPALS